MPGDRHLRTDGWGIPTGSDGVDGRGTTSGPRPLAGVRLDDAHTDLERGEAGRAWVTPSAHDGGRWVSLWMDGSYRYLELFTGDSLPDPRGRQGHPRDTHRFVSGKTCAHSS